MRKGVLAALTVLLAGHALAFAQPYGSCPAGQSGGPTGPPPEGVAAPPAAAAATATPVAPVSLEADGDVDAQARTFGLWGSGEYLLWWFKPGRVPPLVTAGGNGKLGSPLTQVLVDNLDFDDDVRQGGRFALGYRCETIPLLGVEAGCFFLPDRHSDVRFASGGDPLLAQPFINAATGMPDANLVAKAGVATGTVTVGAQTGLWGVEANLATDRIGCGAFHWAALGGFRFVRLDDELTSGEQFEVAPGVPGFGGSRVNLLDEFRTVNRFYGGQVGLEAGVQYARLTMDFRGKLALGGVHQVADVSGALERLSPDGSMTIFQGGLFALRSNSGRHQRDELAFLPEVGLNVGLQLTQCLQLYAGYSFLWVSTVARAGEQIDPVVNVTQLPIRSGVVPLVGSARPAFNFDGTDFWAQGLNLGLELRY
jgi:hypothetical protein